MLKDLELPHIAQIGDNLFAACFSVIKLFAARAILDDARARGLLKPGTPVIESTSGTFGLALAMLRPYYGYELTLVSDPVIDPMLRLRFEQSGVHLEIVESPQDGSYQVARLARVRTFLEKTPGAFFTNQYFNPVNATGYATLADHLLSRLGYVDTLVGAVGTGGSMCGTGRRLRALQSGLTMIGVDTPCSVIFGQPNGPRQLRGLGNSLVPGNVDHALFDQVHWVSAAEAYRAARTLHSDHGLFMGGTSGAAYLAGKWYARTHPGKRTLILCPDEGYRYLATVYDDTHLQSLPGAGTPMPDQPVAIRHPATDIRQWSYMAWNRRTLAQVQAIAD